MTYCHYGNIKFNTEKEIEKPYINDLEQGIANYIAEFLRKNDFQSSMKKYRVSITIKNQPW